MLEFARIDTYFNRYKKRRLIEERLESRGALKAKRPPLRGAEAHLDQWRSRGQYLIKNVGGRGESVKGKGVPRA